MRIIFLLIFINTGILFAQKVSNEFNLPILSKGMSRVMFYNCENFFDCENDTLCEGDDTYLPFGDLHWTEKRFRIKRNALARAIIGVGTSAPPVLVGLCEIENAEVLTSLCDESPLRTVGYKFVHRNSPDHRGIDVALLYQPSLFEIIETRFLRGAEPWKSREMLAVKGVLAQSDTLVVVVCHWPSKKGGAMGERLRAEIADVAANYADSILNNNPNVALIFCGDFNDEANSSSILKLCNNVDKERLVDLAARTIPSNIGSHKFRGHWGTIDHFMVSKNLINNGLSLQLSTSAMYIAALPFLIEADETALGIKPFRTYLGFRYHAGTSDHLPVFIDLQKNNH